jgi:hypothetical protein
MGKVTVKLVGKIESIKCRDCRNGIRIDDRFVFCVKRTKINYANQSCPEAVKGECDITEQSLEKIIDIYLGNREMIEILNEQNEAIKNMLVSIVRDSGVVGKYDIKIVRATQKRLDTERVKELLESQGLLDSYLTEVELVYPKIRRL